MPLTQLRACSVKTLSYRSDMLKGLAVAFLLLQISPAAHAAVVEGSTCTQKYNSCRTFCANPTAPSDYNACMRSCPSARAQCMQTGEFCVKRGCDTGVTKR